MIYQGLKLKRTWVEINLDYLKYNLSQIKKILDPNCKIMGVVKADAYGHGDKIIAKQLEDFGVNFLGVSNIEEALSLRRSGVKIPILILGYTPPHLVNILFQYNITQTIYSLDYARKISEEALKNKVVIKSHLKIDTGMNRIGFKINNNLNIEYLLKIYSLPALDISGIFTHFSVADGETVLDEKFTLEQFKIFKNICDELQKLGVNIGIRHCCNSAATIRYKEMHLDMVRTGILLYGPYLNLNIKMDFRPIMTLKTKISMIKTLEPGESVGYGRKFVAIKPTKIATIPIGYADGLNRLCSNKTEVLVSNQKAKIIGSICMDQTMIDVTNIDNLKEDDEVVLWGDESCNLNNIANMIKTISYELLCNVNKRVPRQYIKNNKEYLFVDYTASI